MQNNITAPISCKVLSVQKAQGDKLKVGDVAMVIESMKMEVSIKASKDGELTTRWNAGDAVDEGMDLAHISRESWARIKFRILISFISTATVSVT